MDPSSSGHHESQPREQAPPLPPWGLERTEPAACCIRWWGCRSTPTIRFSDYFPLPVRVTVLGLFEALLLIVNTPFTAAAAVGMKFTLSLQVLPAATGTLHVPKVAVNWGLDELSTPTVKVPGPLFVTVSVLVFVWLIFCAPNASVAGTAIVGTGVTLVPVRLTVCGDPAALLAMLTLAVFAPSDVGAKRTVTVQDAPGSTVAQFVVEVNWFAFSPVRVTPPAGMTRF